MEFKVVNVACGASVLKVIRCNALKNGNMHLMLFK